MADGVVRLPTPAKHVDKKLRTGYCVVCIKRALGLSGTSADEVDIVARQRTPGALDGLCVECGKDRRAVLEAEEERRRETRRAN